MAGQVFPYIFVDATFCKARVNRRVVSQAVVVATGVCSDGRREVLGFAVGDSQDGAFWTAFLRSLKALRLPGVQLVIADAHLGLRQAVGAVMVGAAVQRCLFHFLRNVLAQVPKSSPEMVAAAIRTIFAQPDATHVHEQLDVIAGMLGRQFPKLETMLRDAAEDLLAFTSFPPGHWKKLSSTNPLERLNKEIKRRTDVVGVFPNPEALLRLAAAVLVEAHDESQVSDRRYLSESSMALLTPTSKEVVAPPSSCRHRLPTADPARQLLHHATGRHPSTAVRTVGGDLHKRRLEQRFPVLLTRKRSQVQPCRAHHRAAEQGFRRLSRPAGGQATGGGQATAAREHFPTSPRCSLLRAPEPVSGPLTSSRARCSWCRRG